MKQMIKDFKKSGGKVKKCKTVGVPRRTAMRLTHR